MRRQRQGATLLCAAAAVAAVLLCKTSILGFDLKEELQQIGKVWEQPHQFRVIGSQFEVDQISQGDHWQLRVTEAGQGAGRPTFFSARENGGSTVYGINFDTDRSKHKPILGKRATFSAAADDEGGDWTLQVEGDNARKFSVTGNAEDIVYDGSFGAEIPVGKGITALYALDLKKRPGEGVLPTWSQHSAGLRHSSKFGNLKVNMHLPSKDSDSRDIEYDAVFRGKLSGLGAKGSKVLSSDPQYILRAADKGFSAKLRAPGRLGTSFGFETDMERDGSPKVTGYTEWAGKRKVAKGLELGTDAKVVATGNDVKLLPVGFSATADLSTLLPDVADPGSQLALRGRYELGSERPAVSATAELRSAQLAKLKLAAQASVDSQGSAASGMQISASSNGLDAHYEVASDEKHGLRQAAEVKLPPAQVGSYDARGTARLYQGEEHGGKPRLQLGVQYEGSANIKGRQLSVGGESAAYDSGRRLLDEMGKPWTSPELKKARNSAATLRKRIASEFGEGRRWLQQ